MSPYRNMNLPTMPRPSWWSRLCAAVTPKRIGAQHQWYRRAVGGRWSQIPGDGDSWRWVRTPVCLGPVVTRALGGEPAPVGVCFDERENNLMIDEEIGHFELTAHECHCEVWP